MSGRPASRSSIAPPASTVEPPLAEEEQPQDEPFLDRATRSYRHLEGVGAGCDVLVYTQDEMARLRAERSGIVRAADREGIVLARR